jgi:hypothetical protein
MQWKGMEVLTAHAHHNRRMVAVKIDALTETIDNVASSG